MASDLWPLQDQEGGDQEEDHQYTDEKPEDPAHAIALRLGWRGLDQSVPGYQGFACRLVGLQFEGRLGTPQFGTRRLGGGELGPASGGPREIGTKQPRPAASRPRGFGPRRLGTLGPKRARMLLEIRGPH